MPGGLHPHAHADSSLLQFSVELLGFTIAVIQLPFSALPSFLIHKSDLLKARMIIHTYNDHVGSFLSSLGRNATTVYSGRGSRHCNEITRRSSFAHDNVDLNFHRVPVRCDCHETPPRAQSIVHHRAICRDTGSCLVSECSGFCKSGLCGEIGRSSIKLPCWMADCRGDR